MREELPLVSVIIPAYNAYGFIGQAIESVINQDYGKLEVIIIDDGSTDGTLEYARSFGDRIIVLEQANAGPAAARNHGVSVARGEFLAFLDADDVWVPGKLAAQVTYLVDNPDVGIVYGRFLRWVAHDNGLFGPPPLEDNSAQDEVIISDKSGWLYPELLLDSIVWICTATIRRQIWESLGGLDEILRIGEDWDFFIRASRCCRITQLNRLVAYYRIHKQSTTNTPRKENNGYIVLKRALENFGVTGPDGRQVSKPLLRDRLATLCLEHGYDHYRHGSPLIAIKSLWKSLGYYPLRVKFWAYLLLSIVRFIKLESQKRL
jgi:glycosyltransferase involved in cell wall biosynthesis